jgi:hypothetical protein
MPNKTNSEKKYKRLRAVNLFLVISALLLFILNYSQEETGHEKYFYKQITSLLNKEFSYSGIKEKEEVKINLKDFTDFEWDKVCFQHTKEAIFYLDRNMVTKIRVRPIFFIKESYEKNSIDRSCFQHGSAQLKIKIENLKQLYPENNYFLYYFFKYSQIPDGIIFKPTLSQ